MSAMLQGFETQHQHHYPEVMKLLMCCVCLAVIASEWLQS